MEQYISKSALVAEIERRKSQFMSQSDNFHSLGMEEKRDHFAVLASNMHSILSFIDTLEVKESLTWQDIRLISEIGEKFMNSEESDNLSEEEYYTEILNRFKAQKGEKA